MKVENWNEQIHQTLYEIRQATMIHELAILGHKLAHECTELLLQANREKLATEKN